MMTYQFALEGISPLLMHADDVERADVLDAWRKHSDNKDISKPGDDRSPPWSWQSYLYYDEDGMVTIPSDNLMVALRFGGSKMSMKGQETFKSVSQSGLLIKELYLEFSINGKGAIAGDKIAKLKSLPFSEQAAKVEKDLGFKLFVKRAVVKSSKHVRVRPRFDHWNLRGTIEILEPVITEAHLKTMFEIAGSRAGLGDWRPSEKKSPGPYGRFLSSLQKAK